MGHPTIYPTGVTVYNPEKCWNGFTIFQALEVGAVLMNMNGRENKVWKGVHGFPNKIFPGGYLMTSRGSRDGRYGVQDGLDLVQIDWDGNVVWKFDRNEYIEDPGIPGRWMARSHHDYQREGSTTGYYAPGMEPKTDSGNTLVLAHRNARNPKISDKQLLDDVILEVDWDGDIVWEWHCNEHFDEMGFREGPKNTLARDPNYRQTQPEAWATGCTSTPCPCSARTNGMTRATSASIPTTSSWTAAKPTSFSSSPRLPGKSSGNSAPTTTTAPKPRPSAGSSASTTATWSRADCPERAIS